MRVVIDANVIISSLITSGLSQQVVNVCMDDHDIFLSRALMDEVFRFFAKKRKLSPEEKVGVTKFLKELGTLLVPRGDGPSVCRDKDDNHVLHLAETCRARALITGDQDLLVLKRFKATLILTPRQFLEGLEKGAIGRAKFT